MVLKGVANAAFNVQHYKDLTRIVDIIQVRKNFARLVGVPGNFFDDTNKDILSAAASDPSNDIFVV